MSNNEPIELSITTSCSLDKDHHGVVLSPLIASHTSSFDNGAGSSPTLSTPSTKSPTMSVPLPQSQSHEEEPSSSPTSSPTKKAVTFAIDGENYHDGPSLSYHSFHDQPSHSKSFDGDSTQPYLKKSSFDHEQKENTFSHCGFALTATVNPKLKKTVTNIHRKKQTIPSSGYGKWGEIGFRADNLAILCRKWTKSGCWLHVYPATINLFDSFENMEKWKELNDSDELDSKTKRNMNQLVKKSINFDTTGDFKKNTVALEKKRAKVDGRDDDSSPPAKKRSKDEKRKGKAILPRSYIMEEVRSKYYHLNEPLMHTCKISYLGLSGRHVSVAFGSSLPRELKRIRAVVRDILKLVKKAAKKHSKKKLGVDSCNSTYNISTTRSELTTLSNTVYGQNTMNHTRKYSAFANINFASVKK